MLLKPFIFTKKRHFAAPLKENDIFCENMIQACYSNSNIRSAKNKLMSSNFLKCTIRKIEYLNNISEISKYQKTF